MPTALRTVSSSAFAAVPDSTAGTLAVVCASLIGDIESSADSIAVPASKARNDGWRDTGSIMSALTAIGRPFVASRSSSHVVGSVSESQDAHNNETATRRTMVETARSTCFV